MCRLVQAGLTASSPKGRPDHVQAMVDDYLKPGNILVINDCAIHGRLESFDIFISFLEIYDITHLLLSLFS